MNIIHKNDGAKIPYTIRGSKITFDDEVMYNLTKYERDEASHIDLCRDKFGNLVSGVIPGGRSPGHGARDADALERGGLRDV